MRKGYHVIVEDLSMMSIGPEGGRGLRVNPERIQLRQLDSGQYLIQKVGVWGVHDKFVNPCTH